MGRPLVQLGDVLPRRLGRPNQMRNGRGHVPSLTRHRGQGGGEPSWPPPISPFIGVTYICMICKMSLADCFAAALAKQRKLEVYTGDPEFKAVEKEVKVVWV